MRSALQLAAIVSALVVTACAADPVPITACTAGVSTACTCSSSAQGAQVCRADGSGYGACVCTGGDAGGDAGDAVAVADALQLDASADGGGDAVAVSDVVRPDPMTGRCPGILSNCDGQCLDVRPSHGDPMHCGSCNFSCNPGLSCVDGEGCVLRDGGRD